MKGNQEMMEHRFSRRGVLAFGVGTSISMTLLLACGNDDEDDSSSPTTQPTPDSAAPSETSSGEDEMLEPTESSSDSDSDAGNVSEGGTLRFCWNSDARSLAPYQFTASIERCVGSHIFETLVVFNEVDTEFLPGLATSWELSPDGTTCTFQLREGVTFHDGTEFNADTVKFTFDWIANPDSKASPFTTGFLAGYSGTEVIGPTEVTVTFDEPNGRFFDGIANYYLSMLSPAAVEQFGEDIGSNPVGTGPFRFDEWIPNERIEIVQNPDYNWGVPGYSHEGPAHLDGLSVRIIAEDVTRSAALERGEVDMINLSFADTPRFEANPDLNTTITLRPGTVRAVHYNVLNDILSDPDVRRAIAHAVDPEAIIRAPFFGGAAAVAHTPLSPTMLGYDESVADLAVPYDPDAAADLLDQAGWELNGDGIRQRDGQPLKLVIGAANATFLGDVAELVQSQLLDVGIDSELSITDWASLFGIISNGEYDLLIAGAFQSDLGVIDVVFDPETKGSNGLLFTRSDDEELAELISTAASTIGVDERLEAYLDVQNYVMENVLISPIYIEPYVFVSATTVKGVRSNVDGEPRFHSAYLD